MPKRGSTAEPKKVLPPFYAFGKLDKKGQISDKKGAAALAKASVKAGGVLGRLIPAHFASVQYAQTLKQRWHTGALDIQRTWRGHCRRGIARWDRNRLDLDLVVQRQTPGHVRRAGDLQRVWRGHVQRKRVAYGDSPKWHAAASKLQRLYRGSVTRQLTKQLKYVRSVPAAFMLVGMAVLGDSGVLRRGGAGKCRNELLLVPSKPGTARSGAARPQPATQSTVASAAKPPAGPSVTSGTFGEEPEKSGQQLEREVERAMQLSQLFLVLTDDQLDLVFNCMDVTGQGFIRRQEVVKAAKSAQLSDLCVDLFFMLADSDEDGVVDRKEFNAALSFTKHFFNGSLLDQDEVTDVTTVAKVHFLKKQLKEYHAEVQVLVDSLLQFKPSLRVPAIVALSRRDRIRVARANRGVLQDATVYMDRQQERNMRRELSEMSDEPDQAKEIQATITKMEEDMIYKEYFLLRSPCRQRRLSRANLAVIEAERLAAEEAARLALLEKPAMLRITVIGARDLIAADRSLFGGSSSDPYVTLQIGDQEKKTKIKKKTLNPEWNETFEVLLDKKLRCDEVRLECFDHDLIGDDDSLGHITIPLEFLVHNSIYEEWHSFKNEQGKDGKGEIQLRYKLMLQSEEEAEEARILAALAEAPAMLEITVLRAVSLIAADRGGTSDPYVHIQVGEAKKAAQKTSVKKKTLDPEWNEAFKMRLESAQRRDALSLECFDYDMLNADDSLGKIEIALGSLVLGQEYTKWHRFQQEPGKDGKGKLKVRYRLIVRNQAQNPSTLHVRVVRARDLVAADRGGTSDPYVRLHVGEAVKSAKKTKVKKKTLNPEWNHDFKFRLNASEIQNDLTIEAFDYDMIGADDSLGKVSIAIDSLRSNEEYQEWHRLRQVDGQVGEIELRYKLVGKSEAQAQAEAKTLGPGTLTVTVKSAKNLLAADRGGTSDPYIRMHIGEAVKEAKKTQVIKKTLDPEWNETFKWELDRAQRLMYMTFECFDYDMLSADDSLGSFDLELDSLLFDRECVEWYDLVQEGESEHQGAVQVQYTFVPSAVEEVDDIPTETHPVLTLPASAVLGPATLEFTVVRAKDLTAADRGGTSDPYVCVHVGDAVKEAKKTQVKKKTLTPEWNETFEIKIDASKRRKKMTIECFDYDMVGSDDSLGSASIALAHLVPDHQYIQWCKLGNESANKGQIQVRFRLTTLPHLASTVSLPLPGAPSPDTSARLEKAASSPVHLLPTQEELQAAAAEEEKARVLDDARERMVLSSCSVFRLVVHPLMLPSVHNRESALQRHRTIEKACCTAMLEIRLALREGDEKFARARELLGRGHFQDAAAQLKLVQLCYEYADCIEREANVFFEARSNLVLFDEGTAEETAKIDQIQQVHADIDIMFKDSTRGVWPLHKAASQGAIGTIRYLIQNFGERVDAVDRAGKTALHVAVENDQLETTRVLIQDFGADPSRRTFTGRTPIHIASDHGHADMVRGLFEGCAAVITDEVTKGLRRALDKQGIAREALVVLGAWKDTDHANNALALAAHKLHTDVLHVYALVQGLEEEQDGPTTPKSTRSKLTTSAGDSLELLRNLSDDRSVRSDSDVSMDEDEEAKANEEILRTLNVLDNRDSQHMAPFPPCVHKTHTLEDLESDLFQIFRRKNNERGIRTALRSRPVSASSGSEGSRPSTAGSKASQVSHLLAMLRGEFHVRLTIVEGRDLRGRPRNVAPSTCIDVTWLPAAHGAEPLEVNERTRIVQGSIMPAWNSTYNFDVDPDGPEGWSLLTFNVRDVHKDSGKEDFLGIVTVDMAALLFGVTAGWYELQENVDLRGPEVSARSRLRLGQIRPMQPIQGAIYLEMEATNPVSHLPKPPPQDPIEIYEEEVMAQVMEENRGASRRRRKMIIKDMWDKLLVDNPRAIEGYTEQVSTLHDDHIERMNNQVLIGAADGEVIAIHYCVKQGADPNFKKPKNNSALFIAAHRGHHSVVDALIKYKADVHVRNEEGATPLYQAAANGHAPVVKLLVAANADMETKTNTQSTPLLSAARNGKADSVSALLELRADPNPRNSMGATPLHLAVFASHAECVRILLDNGANSKLTIKRGALAGTMPYELAKTEEILDMLEEHQSKSGIFGIMSFSTSRSFNSTRRNLDSSHTDAAQHSPQRQALVEQAHKPEMVQAGTTSPRQRTARSQRSHQSSDSQKKKRLEILTTGVVAATASSARLAKSPPETQFSQLKNKCEFK